MDQQVRRLRLRVAAKLMLLVAFFTVVYVVLSVLLSSDQSTRVIPTQIVDISGLRAGDHQIVLWDGRPVLLYRRTEADMINLAAANERLLDASSNSSRQPSWATNAHRSREPEWFVSLAVGTDFSCPIKYLAPSPESFMDAPWRGGFVDDCRGSRYDLAGRVYQGQYADENLIVPDYARKADVIILGSQ